MSMRRRDPIDTLSRSPALSSSYMRLRLIPLMRRNSGIVAVMMSSMFHGHPQGGSWIKHKWYPWRLHTLLMQTIRAGNQANTPQNPAPGFQPRRLPFDGAEHES